MDTKIQPSAVWYGVGAGIATLAGAAAVVVIVSAFVSYFTRIDDLERVSVPGEATLFFEEGGHTVYLERDGIADNDFFFSGVDVRIEDPDGRLLSVEPYDSIVTYDTGGREGRALSSFQVEQAGPHLVTVADLGEIGFGEVALGRSVSAGLVRRGLLAVVFGGLGVLAGGAVALVTGIRRSREKRRRRPPPWQPPGWGAPGGWQQPPSGWQQPPSGWQQPPSGWQQPPSGWQQPPSGWQQPPSGWQQPPGGQGVR